MSNDHYHHGNLKNALIEAGIEMVNEIGEENLSLRKTAARCGVSNAAPYAHFANKEEMIQAMQDYVTDKFMESLKAAVRNCKDPYTNEGIICFGMEYINFFLENPKYYSFLFAQPCMKVNLSFGGDQKDNFSPYEYFKEILQEYNRKKGTHLSTEEQEIQLIKLWSTVHGISAIATMKNVTWDKAWKDQLHLLLT